MKKFIKENVFFVIVTSMVVMIVGFAFSISFTSMVQVAKDLHISIPVVYPLLFELTSVMGGAIKAYLEVKKIDDKFTKLLANIMLYTGVILSVMFNVYHVIDYMSADKLVTSIFLVIAHSIPSLLVVTGAEIIIAVGRHTFADNETTGTLQKQMKELLDKLTDTNASLEKVSEQNKTLIVQNDDKSKQLKRYNEMPAILEAILQVHNEEKEVDELDKLFKFSQNRFTSLQKFMTQDVIEM